MKKLIFYALTIILSFGFAKNSISQGYSLKITKSTFMLSSISFSGYATTFDTPYKEVKKEWWRYVNARAIIFNNKTHYILTIPAQKKESNTPLKFVSQLVTNKQSKFSVLKIGAVPDGMSKDQLKSFDLQLKNMLKDFKIEYFTAIIQDQIDKEERFSKRISSDMDKYYLHNSKLNVWVKKKPEEKDKFLNKIKENKKEIERLRAKLLVQDKEMERLKEELTLIK